MLANGNKPRDYFQVPSFMTRTHTITDKMTPKKMCPQSEKHLSLLKAVRAKNIYV